MSASNVQSNPASKANQSAFSAIPGNNSLLLEKFTRRSTPDSEALASSDDEPDAHRQETPQAQAQAQAQAHKPTLRRSSWLNDTSQMPLSLPRKNSFAGNTMSPTTTQPIATAGLTDNAPSSWYSQTSQSSSLGRSQGSTFNWGNTIWNNERKEPPSRLTEVLPSPTSTGPPSLHYEPSMQQQASPPSSREQGSTQIPFPIPLHPTPKTYRSQSYSVGQLDPDTAAPVGAPPSSYTGRSRPMGHPGLQHRPSRPSMLSEMSNEGLSKVKEVDDDDDGDSTGSSGHGSQHRQSQAKQIESLVRENALLRQQQQYQAARMRPRASTAASYGHGNGYSVHQPVPEESDFAVDELDEPHDGYGSKRNMGRRMSEYAAGAYRPQYPPENRKLENVKKAFWTSSLGFGGIGDPSQSRRHSFAEIPTRQDSISSIGEGGPLRETQSNETQSQDLSGYPDRTGFSTSPVNYYPNSNLPGSQAAPSAGFGSPYQSAYGLPPSYAHQPPSPHRNIYGLSSPRHNQLLQIVLFKCSRAEVFYIQEGTGLTVKPGDLVIVEADRGTDLGTVACDNLDWQKAKEMKEHYSEEHYKWLMMYSANAAAAQEGTGSGMMAASSGFQGSAIGGMGPPNQHHLQEPNAGELKPKLIKRLAQSHEIHSLREKEGNEAKAKRVCMQKVKEHGLNMEILDAEFQMDWKKLTFYYFADAYINFNSLVTDLFKIYKTRIWMSAINPASFATPTLGLQAPSGIGPGAVGHGRSAGSGNNERRPQPPQESPGYPSSSGSNRAFPSGFNQSYNTAERSPPPSSGYPPANVGYTAPYGAFAGAPRGGGMPYVPGVMQAMDAYGAFPSSGDYAPSGRGRFPSPHTGMPPHEQPGMTGQADWAANFQGLSLNSR